jgi:release factor glutamine methyltransferase
MAVKLQTIKDIRKYLVSELAAFYSENEILSLTGIILTSVLKTNRLKLLGTEKDPVDPKDAVRIVEMCEELKNYKPIQYITGETFFYDCVIKVGPEVMIPRPETEELVDLIIKENREFTGKILDIGTGSGCIAIALAVKLSGSSVSAIDISVEALELAKVNAAMNSVKIDFIQADILMDNFIEISMSDIIVSNPPYVRNSEKQFIKRNVLDFEPHEALFVLDSDPLVFYRAILEKTVSLLNQGGRIYFEINEAMGRELFNLAGSFGFKDICVFKDLNGKERILKGTKNG